MNNKMQEILAKLIMTPEEVDKSFGSKEKLYTLVKEKHIPSIVGTVTEVFDKFRPEMFSPIVMVMYSKPGEKLIESHIIPIEQFMRNEVSKSLLEPFVRGFIQILLTDEPNVGKKAFALYLVSETWISVSKKPVEDNGEVIMEFMPKDDPNHTEALLVNWDTPVGGGMTMFDIVNRYPAYFQGIPQYDDPDIEVAGRFCGLMRKAAGTYKEPEMPFTIKRK